MAKVYTAGIMSEIGPSGAIGGGSAVAVATAGPALGSAGFSAEGGFGSSGVGFDGGSPTFSGLGRSDSGINSFSVNEGSIGPVSFTNSEDLFTETKSMSPFDTSNTEKAPANFNGDLFANTEMVAENSIAPESATKAPNFDVFKDTVPMPIMEPVAEKAVSSFALRNTVSLWENPNTSQRRGLEEAVESDIDNQILESMTDVQLTDNAQLKAVSINPETEVEAVIEEYISAQSDAENVDQETIAQVLVEVRAEAPETITEIRDSLETAAALEAIAQDLDIQPESTQNITNAIVADSIAKTGIAEEVETIAQTQTETEMEVEAEAESEQVTDKRLEQKQAKEKSRQNVIDEAANKAREEEIISAAEKIVEASEPGVKVINGSKIVDFMPGEPTSKEISGLIHQEGGKDGSYNPMLQQLGQMIFTSDDQVFAAARQVVSDNTAVVKDVSGTQAKKEEVEKVKKGTVIAQEIQVYPLAA